MISLHFVASLPLWSFVFFTALTSSKSKGKVIHFIQEMIIKELQKKYTVLHNIDAYITCQVKLYFLYVSDITEKSWLYSLCVHLCKNPPVHV